MIATAGPETAPTPMTQPTKQKHEIQCPGVRLIEPLRGACPGGASPSARPRRSCALAAYDSFSASPARSPMGSPSLPGPSTLNPTNSLGFQGSRPSLRRCNSSQEHLNLHNYDSLVENKEKEQGAAAGAAEPSTTARAPIDQPKDYIRYIDTFGASAKYTGGSHRQRVHQCDEHIQSQLDLVIYGYQHDLVMHGDKKAKTTDLCMERVPFADADCRAEDDAELTQAELEARDSRLARARGGRAHATARQPPRPATHPHQRGGGAQVSPSSGDFDRANNGLPRSSSGPLPRSNSGSLPRGRVGSTRRRRLSSSAGGMGSVPGLPFRLPNGVITVRSEQWQAVQAALSSMASRLEEAEARATMLESRCTVLYNSTSPASVMGGDGGLDDAGMVADEARAVADAMLADEDDLDDACDPTNTTSGRAVTALRASADRVDRFTRELAFERASSMELRQRHERVRSLARRLLDKSRARRREMAAGSGGEEVHVSADQKHATVAPKRGASPDAVGRVEEPPRKALRRGCPEGGAGSSENTDVAVS